MGPVVVMIREHFYIKGNNIRSSADFRLGFKVVKSDRQFLPVMVLHILAAAAVVGTGHLLRTFGQRRLRRGTVAPQGGVNGILIVVRTGIA